MPTSLKNDRRITVIGTRVDLVSYSRAVSKVVIWAADAVSRYVVLANVHVCMEAFDSSLYQKAVNEANLILPDGRPISWTGYFLNGPPVFQIRGTDFLLELCHAAQKERIPVGFFGGTPEDLTEMTALLAARFPELNVSYQAAPPFRPPTQAEESAFVSEINASGVRILFVALGCPRQEMWMAAHKGRLSCVMVGIGAALEFAIGKWSQAPLWVQKAGFEWLHRLMHEPRRLLKRYLKHNPRFIWYFCIQWMKQGLRRADAGRP